MHYFSFLKTISLCCSICSRILLFKSDSLITFWTLYCLIVLYLETYRSQTTGSVIPALQHLFVVLFWFLCCFWLFSDIGLLLYLLLHLLLYFHKNIVSKIINAHVVFQQRSLKMNLTHCDIETNFYVIASST